MDCEHIIDITLLFECQIITGIKRYDEGWRHDKQRKHGDLKEFIQHQAISDQIGVQHQRQWNHDAQAYGSNNDGFFKSCPIYFYTVPNDNQD